MFIIKNTEFLMISQTILKVTQQQMGHKKITLELHSYELKKVNENAEIMWRTFYLMAVKLRVVVLNWVFNVWLKVIWLGLEHFLFFLYGFE